MKKKVIGSLIMASIIALAACDTTSSSQPSSQIVQSSSSSAVVESSSVQSSIKESSSIVQSSSKIESTSKVESSSVIESTVITESSIAQPAKLVLPNEIASFADIPTEVKQCLNLGGYASEVGDFAQYVGTEAYRVVSTPEEFLTAIKDAKYDYKNTYNEETNTIEQTLNKEGSVHVIEIANDLDLGYYKLSEEAKNTGVVSDYANKVNSVSQYLYLSEMFLENGISQVKKLKDYQTY